MDLTGFGAAFSFAKSVIDRVVPDPAAKQAATIQLAEMAQKGDLAQLAADTDLVKAQIGVITAEAASSSVLASSWRPITMLVFVGLICARWFGISAANLGQAEYMELWSIVKLGLGGDVIGRSAEKIVPAVAASVAQANAGKETPTSSLRRLPDPSSLTGAASLASSSPPTSKSALSW